MESVLGLVRHSGNEGLLRAIEMSLLAAVSGQALHLHAEGLRGTGKTTIMRAARRVLPRIRRIKGCLYNCDPAYPHCPIHRRLTPDQVLMLEDEWVPMPFLEISHSAKVGSAVGSIDLGRLVNPGQPEAALLPGTIPQAHRGIIFVDEINRLAETAPELADVLLDVMGTKPGRVQIEETGIPSVELGVQVTVWAASNPDEDPGPLEEIRRQLSDRFDFVVYTDRPTDAAAVERILVAAEEVGRHRQASRVDDVRTEQWRTQLLARAASLPTVQMPQPLRQGVAELYSRFSLESLRAVQALQAGMRLAACLDKRQEASLEDLARVATLALRHRVDGETMKKITAHLVGLSPKPEGATVPAAARPRFPNISFGAAAVQPLPEKNVPGDQVEGLVPAHTQPRSGTGDPTTAQTVHRVWPPDDPATQQGPAQQAGQRAGESHGYSMGWLARSLERLRQHLGHGLGPSDAANSPRVSGRGGSERPGMPQPRPGRLYQESGRLAPWEGDRAGASHGAQRPQGQADCDPRSGSGPRLGGSAPPVRSVDPMQFPPVAPPALARPLSALEAHELIRTEEELDRQ